MEEQWTPPKGGMMLGIHRDVRGEKAVSFEFFRIEETPQGLVYQAQPRGRPAVPFPCKEIVGSKVVFENLEHDFPQRIIYAAESDGRLRARVEGMQGGKLAPEEWVWTRAK